MRGSPLDRYSHAAKSAGRVWNRPTTTTSIAVAAHKSEPSRRLTRGARQARNNCQEGRTACSARHTRVNFCQRINQPARQQIPHHDEMNLFYLQQLHKQCTENRLCICVFVCLHAHLLSRFRLPNFEHHSRNEKAANEHHVMA
jgi:hypothetical protein